MAVEPTHTRPGRWLAAGCGVVTSIGAISSATLVAAGNRAMRSPIVDVGDRFIEVTPGWLKDLAISLFGTNDKLALLVGTGLLLLLFSAGVGLLAMRRRLLFGMLGVVLFGVIGMAAALGSGRGPVAALPSLAGAIAAIALLGWLHHLWFDFPRDDAPTLASRRRLIGGLGGAALGAGLVGMGSIYLVRSREVPPGPLPPVASPLPAVPSGAGLEVPGLSPFVTPNEAFYRIDTALSVPRIPTADYLLRVHGMVDREMTLGYGDLLTRRQVEADITMTCVSNEVGGQLVGNARWQGIRLDELLAEAGVWPDADQVVGRSYDGYTCGFPVSVASDGRPALVAFGMNGEPLPPEHGFPVRLIVPGLYGYVSATKWLAEIELTSFDAFDHYWERRGWASQAPIKTQSRIDKPAAFEQVPVGRSVIAGVAWAQTRGIRKVEVRIDDGPWQDADLGAAVNDATWRQWQIPWEVTPGNHSITVRATDGTGTTQTGQRVPPVPDGATGWHSVVAMGATK